MPTINQRREKGSEGWKGAGRTAEIIEYIEPYVFFSAIFQLAKKFNHEGGRMNISW